MAIPALHHSPADIIRWMMVAINLGSSPTPWETGGSTSSANAWPIFVAAEPNIPDNVITLYDTTWQSDGRAMHSGEQFQHYGIQVRVRGIDHPTGLLKALTIRETLDQSVYDRTISIPVGSSTYRYTVHCISSSSVLFLGKQTPSSKRSLFTINAKTTIRAVS